MSAVNLKQLAAHLGLTASTVSRALNNYKDISPDTRKRVQEAAKALNYRPSRVAQQLARGKARVDTIAYVMPAGIHRFSDPIFASFIVGVGDTLANAGRDLLITSPSKQISELETYERIIAENKANAFIISRTTPDDERIKLLKKHNIPFVCHGRTQHANDFHWYDADVLEGAKLVAKRFISQGHQRLALITPPSTFNFSRLLVDGFHDITSVAESVSVEMGEGDMSESSGFEITTQWLTNGTQPDAIFCGSDAMAVGAMQAIKQQGLSVGEDIAVIGYGDFPVASYVSPALTTLQQPLHDAGEQVTNMLLQLLEKPEQAPNNVLVPLSLIERESDIKPSSVKKGQ